jgi:putative transposase
LWPAAAAHLDEARDDILAVTALPREVWRQVWSNNPPQRKFARRTDVVGIFPGRDAIIAWSARCWLSRTTNGPKRAVTWAWKNLPPVRKAMQADMGKNGTSEAGLTVEAIPA